MKCHVKACQQETSQYSSDSHLPVCETHSQRMRLWLVSKYDTVCEECRPLYWWCEPSSESDASPNAVSGNHLVARLGGL